MVDCTWQVDIGDSIFGIFYPKLQAQNGVTWIKTHSSKPRLNTEPKCSFNFPGMSPLLQATGSYLISTKKIICPIGLFHSP